MSVRSLPIVLLSICILLVLVAFRLAFLPSIDSVESEAMVAREFLPEEQDTGVMLLRRGAIVRLKDGHISRVLLGKVPSWITDTELAEIAKLPQLVRFELEDYSGFRAAIKLTDAGFKQLQHAHGLTSVNLMGSAVTDDGLTFLEHLPQLESLNLEVTAVTDAGLQYVKKLPHLKHLFLQHTNVSRAFIQQLQQQSPDLAVEH